MLLTCLLFYVSMANLKQPLCLLNRTNYFSPSLSRAHVRLQSPNTYSNRQSKIEGYESRLFYQFKDCQSKGMPVYFYTLTYNDKALPDFFGMPCFDYEDLRDLFTGGFRKQLLRKYGVTFKYFVGAELGDGKGSRGFHNNPHYHVLFFLEPKPFSYLKYTYDNVCIGKYVRNSKYHRFGEDKYKRIRYKTRIVVNPCPPSAEEFRHLVRLYWQGFDQDIVGKIPFEDAKFGIAQEGLYCGLVRDFRACCYCAKYVCKDAGLKAFESNIFELIRDNLVSSMPRSEDKSPFEYDSEINELVRLSINEYRNRFCNKCRISHGVGDYALNFIDFSDPYLLIDDKKGKKKRPLSLYYYRKLFCDVVKDKVPSIVIDKKGRKKVVFNNLYLLNQLGIEYKSSKLEDRISKLMEKTANNLQILLLYPSLYSEMIDSDVNTSVDFDFFDFKSELDYLLNGKSERDLFRLYSEYKLVYEDRFFQIPYSRDSVFFVSPPINPSLDYRRFLSPSFYDCSFRPLGVLSFLEDMPQDWFPYSSHEAFLPYMRVFSVFDLLSDYFFIQKDNELQANAEEIQRVKRYHVKRKMKSLFYES